jgi:hypothetical protein
MTLLVPYIDIRKLYQAWAARKAVYANYIRLVNSSADYAARFATPQLLRGREGFSDVTCQKSLAQGHSCCILDELFGDLRARHRPGYQYAY